MDMVYNIHYLTLIHPSILQAYPSPYPIHLHLSLPLFSLFSSFLNQLTIFLSFLPFNTSLRVFLRLILPSQYLSSFSVFLFILIITTISLNYNFYINFKITCIFREKERERELQFTIKVRSKTLFVTWLQMTGTY